MYVCIVCVCLHTYMGGHNTERKGAVAEWEQEMNMDNYLHNVGRRWGVKIDPKMDFTNP